MSRRLLILVTLFLITLSGANVASAQGDEWRKSPDGNMEFNCETVGALMNVVNGGTGYSFEMSDLQLLRIAGTPYSVGSIISSYVLTELADNSSARLSVDDIFGEALSVCGSGAAAQGAADPTAEGLFSVVVSNVANLRSCATTDCEVVAQVQAGTTLSVIAVDGEWYQVQHEGSTAFIASWLTTRGPDLEIGVDEVYEDPETGCMVIVDLKRGSANLSIVLSGMRSDDIFADLFRPGDTRALTVTSQLDKTFIDTGDPYVHQVYAWNTRWPLGMYQVEIKLDNRSTRIAWNMEEQGDYTIHIYCD